MGRAELSVEYEARRKRIEQRSIPGGLRFAVTVEADVTECAPPLVMDMTGSMAVAEATIVEKESIGV
jgi:hypothetical protein